ncbi:MAG TPA: hypothetical protein VKV41_25245 [Methylomirabilota bacterium]|nr:hypothetical protein [Methylomirabilota bacterium]
MADPKPERLRSALEPGKTVRVTLDGAVDELRLRDGHADLSLEVHGVSVRPEGRKTISSLIEEKQKKAVR